MQPKNQTVQHKNQSLVLAEHFVGHMLEIGAIRIVLEDRIGSEQVSPFIFDRSKFDSEKALKQISAYYAFEIADNFQNGDDELTFNLLYGPPPQGTSLAPLVAITLQKLRYGSVKWCTSQVCFPIESVIKPGDRVLIIDDAITGDGSKRRAADLVQSLGGEPIAVIIAYDPQERGTGGLTEVERFEQEYAIPVFPIATVNDLISFLKKQDFLLSLGKISAESGDDCIGELRERILSFQEQHKAL